HTVDEGATSLVFDRHRRKRGTVPRPTQRTGPGQVLAAVIETRNLAFMASRIRLRMHASSFDSEANQHNHGNGTGKDHCAKNDMRSRLICNLLPAIACVIAEHEEEAAPQDSARMA